MHPSRIIPAHRQRAAQALAETAAAAAPKKRVRKPTAAATKKRVRKPKAASKQPPRALVDQLRDA